MKIVVTVKIWVKINLLLSFFLWSQQSVSAIPLFPQSSPTTTTPNGSVGITDSLQTAQQLYEKKEYKKALKLSLNLLEQAQKDNNIDLIYNSSFLIGSIFNKTNNYDKALQYFKSAYFYLDKKNDEEFLKLNLKIGRNFCLIEQQDSAVKYFENIILQTSKNTSFLEYKAKAYNNLSSIFLEKSNFTKAEYYALESIKILEQNNNHLSTAIALNNLGSTYLLRKKYNEAKTTLVKAVNHLNKIPDSYDKINTKEAVYDNLSEALYFLKDYHAYIYQKESYNIRDSVRSVELSGILSEIEGKYNAENIKKQEQLKIAEEQAKLKHAQDVSLILAITLIGIVVGVWFWYRYYKLRQEKFRLEVTKNQLLQQNELERIQSETHDKILNAALDGKESERKMIAETLHHSVSSLLSSANLHLQAIKMQMHGTEQPQEMEKAQKIINEAAEKIRNLSHSLVSSVLLKFGLAYSIQDLCDKYSNNAIAFNFKSESIKRYDQDFELKINSIIDELLNNIIKHSQATQANISIKNGNDVLEVEVNDNGKGFDISVKNEKAGLGLSQIQARIKKLKGEFHVQSQPNKGTKILMKIPVQFTSEDVIEL